MNIKIQMFPLLPRKSRKWCIIYWTTLWVGCGHRRISGCRFWREATTWNTSVSAGYGDQIAIIYLYWQKGLSDASKFCTRGKVTLACVIGTWRVERHRETQWCPIVDCLIQIFNAFLPRMRASSVCSVSFSSTSNTNYEIKVSIYHMPHSGRHSYVQWLIAWFNYSMHE